MNGINSQVIAYRNSIIDKKHKLPIDEFLKMFYRLELAISNLSIPRENEWSYIPYSHGSFHDHMKMHTNPKTKFLEVGCGLGTKLYIAHKILGIKNVTGIEINPKFVRIAKSMFGQVDNGLYLGFSEPVKVIQQDAFTFQDYDKYDLIYTYDPISDYEKREELYAIIKNKMKPNAEFHRFGGYPIEIYKKP